VPVALQACEWVEHVRANADRVLAFDYAASTAELARRDQAGWLRTYFGHQRASNPLVDPGQRDITHDVPIDQLPPADEQHLQADWLNLHGLPERVEAARQTWTERAHIGDLQAMAARSAIGEAKALTDPTGLGAFLVLEWRGV
jgi:SAM-dependent MidA family methyltransferase